MLEYQLLDLMNIQIYMLKSQGKYRLRNHQTTLEIHSNRVINYEQY